MFKFIDLIDLYIFRVINIKYNTFIAPRFNIN